MEPIVDSGKYDPAINSAYFPNTRGGYCWSGSTYAGDEVLAWLVNFFYGYVFGGSKADAYYVRAVRGGGNRNLDGRPPPGAAPLRHGIFPWRFPCLTWAPGNN